MIFGHERIIQQLLSIRQHSGLKGAILLEGRRGLGKYTLADMLAKLILWDANNSSNNNNNIEIMDFAVFNSTYDNIVRNSDAALKIEANTHPDFMLLQTKEDNGDIKVDQVRGMVQFLQYKPESGKKVIIIDSIDDMNINGCNGLLKALEELPEYAVCFIINHNRGSVLPTIKSRAKSFNLQELDMTSMEAFISHKCGAIMLDANIAKSQLYAFANGIPGMVYEIMQLKLGHLYSMLCGLIYGQEKKDYLLTIDKKDHKIRSYNHLIDACVTNKRYDACLKIAIQVHLKRNIDYIIDNENNDFVPHEQEVFDLRMQNKSIVAMSDDFLCIQQLFNESGNFDKKQALVLAYDKIAV